MRSTIIVALMVAATAAAVVAASSPSSAVSDAIFHAWMRAHQRTYAVGSAEYETRYEAFRMSQERVARRQRHATGDVRFGLTKFADWTEAEFKAQLTFKAPKLESEMPKFPLADIASPCRPDIARDDPTAFDWREHNAISPVKDQGQCGSCWAFSATETVESFWFLANGTLPILSPQQIVDCDYQVTESGCNGGTTQFAYEYVMKNGGMDSEESYPYTSGDSGERGVCMFDRSAIQAQVKSWAYATPVCADFSCAHQDETRMEQALAANGPVSVCLDADAWQDYVSGVMDAATCGSSGLLSMDHCVQAVGYNKQNATAPYWIVRNSWNSNWGLEGYIYLQMGQNTCGVANIATQITV